MSSALDMISWALLVAGGLFCVIGAIGLHRMPDFYTRLHAASVIETLGAALLLSGMALQSGWTLNVAKLAIIGLLIFFTSPAATHALAKSALARGLRPRLQNEESPSKPS